LPLFGKLDNKWTLPIEYNHLDRLAPLEVKMGGLLAPVRRPGSFEVLAVLGEKLDLIRQVYDNGESFTVFAARPFADQVRVLGRAQRRAREPRFSAASFVQ